MPIKKEPFRIYDDPEKRDPKDRTISVRITPKDREWFMPAKMFLKQPKPSTALKQLAEIGSAIVIHDKKIIKIIETFRDNLRRNKRLGIPDEEIEKL